MSSAITIALSGLCAGGAGYLVYDWVFRKELEKKVASGGSFKVHATGYWPSTARPDERKTEGPNNDRKGRPLHTIEDYKVGRSDHVSVAGDYNIFPYGQKLIVDWFGKSIVGRVVDTGGHFTGLKKIYRVVGQEPLDFCVYSKDTPVPKKNVVAQIVVGDHWDKSSEAVATNKFKGQTVAGLHPPSAEDIWKARRRRSGLLALGRRI